MALYTYLLEFATGVLVSFVTEEAICVIIQQRSNESDSFMCHALCPYALVIPKSIGQGVSIGLFQELDCILYPIKSLR